MKRAIPSIIPLVSLALLAGCGGGQSAAPAQGQTGHSIRHAQNFGPDVEVSLPCPQVSVLGEAQTVTLFLPGRTDVAAQVSTAQITGVNGVCVLDKKKHAVDVTVNVNFLAGNGPANNGAAVTLPWFAAITDGDTVIAKQDYSIAVGFNGNMSTGVATPKPLKFEFPARRHVSDMEILIGFEMTPDQLAYAAAHPGASPYLP